MLSEDLSPRAVFAISAAAAATSSSDADGDEPPMSIARLAKGRKRQLGPRPDLRLGRIAGRATALEDECRPSL